MAKPKQRATKPKAPKKPTKKAAATRSHAKQLEACLRDWNGYPVKTIRHARCTCGTTIFSVEAADGAGAKRTCIACKREHLICDSAEYWDDAEPDQCACPCKNETFELAAGFAYYDGAKDIRWIYIALACTKCDQVGVYIDDWKIDYSPSKQLLAQV